MATFNSQTALAAWKKIEYKNGIVKATFMDGDGHLITVAGGEIPHPDFRVKFAQLKYFIDAMLETTPNITEATSVAYPEPGKVQLTAKIATSYTNFEVKTTIIDYGDIQEWEWENEDGENKLLKLLSEINEETRLYIFENKTAQAEIPFPDMKHDGMDGARAQLKIAEGLDTPPTEDVPKTGIKITINENANETN
jgi:hypothetical protein